MKNTWNIGKCLMLGAALLGGLVFAGCEGRVRVYDSYHHDYHHWDRTEDRYYHDYWRDRQGSYREYSTLSPEEQREYWHWRHDHH